MQSLFDRKVNIIRPSKTTDGIGGFVTTAEPVVISDVACYIFQQTGGEEIVFGKDGKVKRIVMYCSIVDIRSGDKVADGVNTYEVLDISSWKNQFLVVGLGLAV